MVAAKKKRFKQRKKANRGSRVAARRECWGGREGARAHSAIQGKKSNKKTGPNLKNLKKKKVY